MTGPIVRYSKFLSRVLRHEPERIGLKLDAQGWAVVSDLLEKTHSAGMSLTRDLLEKVVAENDKQRFSFSEDGLRIRASQGHSLPVDLELEAAAPPELLYHGTATRFLDSIRERGLVPGNRNHVHLSKDEPTAVNVGKRHGRPVVLKIQARRMHDEGHEFFLSANSVWLTDCVPKEYIVFENT